MPYDDCVVGRRVAYLLYLMRGLREEDGGVLELFFLCENIVGSVVKCIVLEFNLLVLFCVLLWLWYQVVEVIGDV